MRHKYSTNGIVLARYPVGEANSLIILLTSEFGLVRAKATGIRKPGAKLASALQVLAQSDVVLIHAKDGWRITGALLERSWFQELPMSARERAGRIASLLLRLVRGESADSELFSSYLEYLGTLISIPEETQDSVECLSALHILHTLGFDAEELPGKSLNYSSAALQEVQTDRQSIILRINRGLQASGL